MDDQLIERDACWWRWRFQPVFGVWGHLGIDYSFESPNCSTGSFLLRHVDYGLPGDRSNPDHRHSIALYAAMIAPGGDGWPPLRTPHGRVFVASRFRMAPRAVGEFLLHRLPRFWGECGAYRTLGPNSNTGLRAALRLCESHTGFHFGRPPFRMRVGAFGWAWPWRLAEADGPYPGYFDEPNRLRCLDHRTSASTSEANPTATRDVPHV